MLELIALIIIFPEAWAPVTTVAGSSDDPRMPPKPINPVTLLPLDIVKSIEPFHCGDLIVNAFWAYPMIPPTKSCALLGSTLVAFTSQVTGN